MTPAQIHALRSIQGESLFQVAKFFTSVDLRPLSDGRYRSGNTALTRQQLAAWTVAHLGVRPIYVKLGLERYLQILGYPTGPQTTLDRFLASCNRSGQVPLQDFYLALQEAAAANGWPLRGWTNRRVSMTLRRRGFRLAKTRLGVIIYEVSLTDTPEVIVARRLAR